jgi:hypothetical protein
MAIAYGRASPPQPLEFHLSCRDCGRNDAAASPTSAEPLTRARGIPLSRLGLRVGGVFWCRYAGWGRWHHEIRLLSIRQPATGSGYPRVVGLQGCWRDLPDAEAAPTALPPAGSSASDVA